MPHKRKKKAGFTPSLEFQPSDSWLYLSVLGEEQGELEVPLPTLALLVLLKHTGIQGARVRLLPRKREEGETSVVVARAGLPPGVEECGEVPSEVRCCRAPVWYLPRQRTCIAGLCSVARYLLRLGYATEGREGCRRLLGRQQSCLVAPVEVSPWTSYCEVEVLGVLPCLEASQLPEAMAKLEAHLAQPIRMHNIREVMQKKYPGLEEGDENLVSEELVLMNLMDRASLE